MIDGRVVVIGGTGFVGRHVTQLLASRGLPVTVIGRRRRGVSDCRNVQFRSMDLEAIQPRDLRPALRGASVVINSTGSIWDRPKEAMITGIVRPTEVLIEALVGLSEVPRYVHLGSVLEAGQGRATDYGAAKAVASDLVNQSGLDRWILQVANAVGPGAPTSSLLGRAAAQLGPAGGPRDSARVLNLGALDSERDFIDVRDVAEAVVAASGCSGRGETVAVGSGRATAARSLVEKLITLSGIEAVIERSGQAAGHSTGSIPGVDLQPARTLIGWEPRRSLDESLNDYWIEFTGKVDV